MTLLGAIVKRPLLVSFWSSMLHALQAAIQQAASQWSVQSMTPSAAADSMASALQQLQQDSQQQQIIIKHVKSIEAKLNALEGSVITAGWIQASSSAARYRNCLQPFGSCMRIVNKNSYLSSYSFCLLSTTVRCHNDTVRQSDRLH